MKPLIGITPSSIDRQAILQHDYMEWISRSGGIPVILPYTGVAEDTVQLAEKLDGLLLSGGADIDPHYFGEEPVQGLGQITPDRDSGEIVWIQEFVRRDRPVLGICRGVQVMNVALGGTLYQDIVSQCKALKHSQKAPTYHPTHLIEVEEGTKLAEIAGSKEARVNSFHHQAVKDVAPGFSVTARAADGIIEAIESTKHRFMLGVQWHPERMQAGDALSERLFAAFVDACRK